MNIDIKGRGWRGGVVKITPTAEGMHIRVDDDWNPELWFEITLDRDVIHFGQGGCAMCSENPEVWLSPVVSVWGEREPKTVEAEQEQRETAKRLREVRVFSQIWKKMASVGHCDGYGGAEYRRVLDEWISQGRPRPIPDFIQRRANIGPDGT